MGTNLTCVKAAGGSISTSPKRDSGNLTEGESVSARAFWPDWRGDRSSVFGLTNALLAGDQVGDDRVWFLEGLLSSSFRLELCQRMLPMINVNGFIFVNGIFCSSRDSFMDLR